MSHLLLIAFSFLSFSAFPSTQLAAANNRFQDHAIIQRRRIVLVRSAEVRRNFPERKTAKLTYPVISGLRPTILKRVRALLSFKNIFDYSLSDYRNDAWLTEFSYIVNHNANSLLDITFTQSGLAAYPDEQSKHFLINLRSGSLVTAADAFRSEKLTALASEVDAELQKELTKLRKENAASSDQADERASVNDAYDILYFEPRDLDNFSISKRGVTFLFDAGFPHVIKALEPSGRYFFTYDRLKPYLKDDGPLGQFVR
ncbi:MAG TPA: hypothetical protein VFH15_04905 [Pyrinomonadaceae bacterium]|nr:hypothetical protein [Pyrinomonadaceae bacterium]